LFYIQLHLERRFFPLGVSATCNLLEFPFRGLNICLDFDLRV